MKQGKYFNHYMENKQKKLLCSIIFAIFSLSVFHNHIFGSGQEINFDSLLSNSENIVHIRINKSKVNFFMYGNNELSCGITYSAKNIEILKGEFNFKTFDFYSQQQLKTGSDYILFLTYFENDNKNSNKSTYEIASSDCRSVLPKIKTKSRIFFEKVDYNKGHQNAGTELWAKYPDDLLTFPDELKIVHHRNEFCVSVRNSDDECTLTKLTPYVSWIDLLSYISRQNKEHP